MGHKKNVGILPITERGGGVSRPGFPSVWGLGRDLHGSYITILALQRPSRG